MRTLASGQAARLSIWRTRVRIPPSLPCVPLVQWITTRVYETRDSGSSPERDANFFGRVFQRPGWGTVYASTGVRLPSRPPSSAVAT